MITFTHSLTPSFLKGTLTLSKIPQKGGIEKLLKGRGDHQKGGTLCERGNTVSLDIFSSWRVANVTTVTFNYILVIVLLFPLNVGFSPCFPCTVLVPVYRIYTSCFCYRLHTSVCMVQVLLLVSVWTFLKCVISQELVREYTHTVWLVVNLLLYVFI